ncbi:hypothetical protein BX661DRAFT_203392 [Kickxella alabastrina]|uniref:uncharacterized protein n=1 Tax=Kickxella alabastrina TaxID=61397 RepID=UPI00222017DD|nr:uncharacterized protein BX661DRAFT_203392 [Kickxella alabastrina]KAI7833773.1 hypothetical protein BX661DRAFT_203392 [Kickxella alabastrina]
MVDLPSQRIYALGALALLVAWKVWRAGTDQLLLFLKWSLLDAAVWYCAWRLRIPKLTVSAPAMYALIAASIFIDINLFLLSSSLFVMAVKPMAVGIASSCLRTLKGVPWLGPRLVGDSDLLIDSFELDDEHILGRHTIHILPHSLAHMNPQTKSFCINDRTLRSEPWYRRLTAGLLSNQGIHHRSQQPTIPILINGTVPASIRYVFTSFETGERQIRAVGNVGALRMETTAVYPTLGNWVMATGAPTLTRPITLSSATMATQGMPEADSADSERTSGLIEAVVEGYEPIDMTIVRLVNGHREVIGLDGVQPRISELSARATAIGAPGDSDESKSATHQVWSRYRARRSVYTLSDTFLRPGEYVYKLESVRDAANHTVALGDSAAIDGNRGLFNGDKASAGKATSYMARIQVVHETKEFSTAKDAYIEASRPGIYHLLSLQDKYCAGKAELANVTLVQTPKPSVNITSTPITARECGGEIGAHIELELSGRPPFAIHYRERNLRLPNSRTVTRVVRSQQRHHSFKVSPELAGIYEFEFFRLEMTTIPAASPSQLSSNRPSTRSPSSVICKGESLEIPLRFKGQGPWQITYNVVHESRRMSWTISDIADDRFIIELGAFDSPGQYTIELAQIKDGNQCKRDLLDIAATIRAHGPGEYELVAANDICPGTIDSQSARCLVKVEPKPRAWFATTGLKYEDKSSAHGEKGVWHLGDTCEASKSPGAFELGLSGSGPWKLEYRIDYWSWSNPQSGNPRTVDRTTTHTSVAMQQSTLKTECCDPGLYRYTLVAVSDERYQRLQPLDLHSAPATKESLTVVEHRVTRSPQAELRAYLPDGTPLDVSTKGAFRRKQRTIKHCLAPGQSRTEGDAQRWASVREQLPVFRIEFEKGGLAPFQAWFVDPSEVGLGRPDQVGASISGGIEIEYIEAPSARPASSSPSANPSRNVCVGDILSFDLRGLNSWNVDYTYNGDHRSTTANKRLFRRLVDEPGNFTLTRVCHRSANDCCSEFSDLAYSVHDIPRVRVSGGKNVYQDILEGDMVDIRMDLVGQPPFTFTWQRRGLATGDFGESVGVTYGQGFHGHAYTISTSSEGTFEVTFIQDQFCQYPKA